MNSEETTDAWPSGSAMRSVLGAYVPAQEDEPQLRDVVGPAIAWGERRRRLDRVLAGTGAVLAVAAIGAGVNLTGGGRGTGADDVPAAAGSCRLPDGRPGSADYCTVMDAMLQLQNRFGAGAIGYISPKLPKGVTVAAAGDGSPDLILTGPGGTNVMELSLEPDDHLMVRCDPGAACPPAPLKPGEAHISTMNDGYPGGGYHQTLVDVEWLSTTTPRHQVSVTVVDKEHPFTPPTINGSPGTIGPASPPASLPSSPPTSAMPYIPQATAQTMFLSGSQVAEIVNDAGFQAYALEQWHQYQSLDARYERLLKTEMPSPTPGGTVVPTQASGAIPPPTGTPWPTSTGMPGPWPTSPGATDPGPTGTVPPPTPWPTGTVLPTPWPSGTGLPTTPWPTGATPPVTVWPTSGDPATGGAPTPAPSGTP